MQHFVPATGGWESLVEAWERELIAGLLEQVLFVLTSQGGPSQEAHRPGTGQRSGESERDSQILASLDFAMEDAAGQSRTTHSPRADAELTPLLEVLLPEASEDPSPPSRSPRSPVSGCAPSRLNGPGSSWLSCASQPARCERAGGGRHGAGLARGAQ